jgi:hypothetical protein
VHIKVWVLYENYLPKKIRVKVKAKDDVGLTYIKVWVEKQGWKTKYLDGENEYEHTFSFAPDAWDSLFDGYDIKVKVEDLNGNGIEAKTHLDGLFESVVKAIIEAIKAFVEAVIELLSMVWEWILDVIEAVVNTIVKPIVDMINRWAAGVASALMTFFDTIAGLGTNFDEIMSALLDGAAADEALEVFNALTGGLLDALKPLFGAMERAVNLLEPFLELVEGIVEEVANCIGDVLKNVFSPGQATTMAITNLLTGFVTFDFMELKSVFLNLFGIQTDFDPEPVVNWEAWCAEVGLSLIAFALTAITLLFSAVGTVQMLFNTFSYIPLISLLVSIVGLTSATVGTLRTIYKYCPDETHSHDALDTGLIVMGLFLSGISVLILFLREQAKGPIWVIETIIVGILTGLTVGAFVVYLG